MSPQTQTERSETLTLKDGFRINYTIIGGESKPLLLFVVGSSGLGSLYRRIAVELSSHFTCVYYDKRGFVPRKPAAGQQTDTEPTNRMVTATQHADDAAVLIKHLSPTGSPVYVFGTSTGGTTVLDLATRYHELLHTAILHEPMTFSILPEEQRKGMIAAYRRIAAAQDPFEGLGVFAEYMLHRPDGHEEGFNTDSSSGMAEPSPFPKPATPSPAEVHNARQGQQEALAMIEYIVDEQGAEKVAGKLVLVCGIDSIAMRVCRPSLALAKLLNGKKRIWELAGGHMSFADKFQSGPFCQQLLFVLHQEGKISLQPQNGPRGKARM